MASFKNLSDLKSLQKSLKIQAEQRERDEEEARKRQLEQKENASIFQSTMKNVTRLEPKSRVTHSPTPPLPIPHQRIADEEAAFQESISDEFTIESLLDTDENLSFARPGIGHDVIKKLRKGHWSIQSELDLHGLRRDEAREALGTFLREARKFGHRCVRIIHGKGHGSFNKEPVLKNKVKIWLTQKEEVLAFCQAKAADGGSGALIVLLQSTSAKNHDE